MAKKKAAQSATGNGTITQVEAVRQALASGVESSKKGMAYIQRKFGMRMKPQAYYSYKSQILRTNGNGKPTSVVRVPTPAKPKEKNDLGDFRTVRDLVEKYGAEQMKEIVELFQ